MPRYNHASAAIVRAARGEFIEHRETTARRLLAEAAAFDVDDVYPDVTDDERAVLIEVRAAELLVLVTDEPSARR